MLAPRPLGEVVMRAFAIVTACFRTMDCEHIIPGSPLIDVITSQDKTLLVSNQFHVDSLIQLQHAPRIDLIFKIATICIRDLRSELRAQE